MSPSMSRFGPHYMHCGTGRYNLAVDGGDTVPVIGYQAPIIVATRQGVMPNRSHDGEVLLSASHEWVATGDVFCERCSKREGGCGGSVVGRTLREGYVIEDRREVLVVDPVGYKAHDHHS